MLSLKTSLRALCVPFALLSSVRSLDIPVATIKRDAPASFDGNVTRSVAERVSNIEFQISSICSISYNCTSFFLYASIYYLLIKKIKLLKSSKIL